MVTESNNRRQPEVKGHYDFRREIMTLMPTAFALKAYSLKPARVGRQGLNWDEEIREGRELKALELPLRSPFPPSVCLDPTGRCRPIVFEVS